MKALRTHLRNKLLAGSLAAGPLVILVLAAEWLEENTKPLSQLLGFHFPGLGVVLAVLGLYLLGVVVTSLVGNFFLRLADRLLQHIPGLSLLYRSLKDIFLFPPGKTSMFARVVLVVTAEGTGTQLGFTNGEPVPGDPDCWCVFLPGVPNPLSGNLVMVRRDACVALDVRIEEAFKFLLSSGIYLPPGLKGHPVMPKLPGESRAPEQGG